MANNGFSMAVPTIAPQHKVMLTIEEACGIFGIGENTFRNLIQSRPDADYLLRIGTKVLIKRAVFENYIMNETELHY